MGKNGVYTMAGVVIFFAIALGFPAKRKNPFTKISHFSQKKKFSRPFFFVFAFPLLAKNAKNFAKFCFNQFQLYITKTKKLI